MILQMNLYNFLFLLRERQATESLEIKGGVPYLHTPTGDLATLEKGNPEGALFWRYLTRKHPNDFTFYRWLRAA